MVSVYSGDMATPECDVSRVISFPVFFQVQFRDTEMKLAKMFVISQIPKLLVCLFHTSAVSYSLTRI